ncbi:MAG: stage 0 sporulation protein [Bacteroidales bacterium]|nr:stage 0 sporulation protein [Bacteroidales bacterium]
MNLSHPSSASPSTRRTYIVRHGQMRFHGIFEAHPPVAELTRGQSVILRTERGLESGEVLCPATPQAIAAIPEPTQGQILRVASADDQEKIQQLRALQSSEYDKASQLIAHHRLPMQLVDVEHLFGGERIIFYFLSENRVDFRELVKSMAREFHARIELRQIGVRDEAKLLADYGDCGKPVCCNTHMSVMPPVSMRMAKIQKSTLDPTKISGRCGRLKCCLRFEQDVYDEFLADLPPIGSRVVTNKGQGRILAHEILARRLLVEFEDGRRLPVAESDVLSRIN